MLRSPLGSACVLLLGATASAQTRSVPQSRPITAPIQNGGTYHVATGTWTPPVQGSQLLGVQQSTGPGIVYDNTCVAASYAPMAVGARFFDEGRLPSKTSPVVANGNGLGNDSEVGTQDSYQIDAFQLAYCTRDATTRSYTVNFYQALNVCGATPATATASFALTGLPGATTAGTLACWAINMDLTNCAPGGTPMSFTMLADADGAYGGASMGNGDTFGWSFQLVSTSVYGADGLILAGGKPAGGSFTTSAGSDGTVFDTGAISARYPDNSDAINLGPGGVPCTTFSAGSSPEKGTGMGTVDAFREENNPPTANGCYTFGAPNMSSFYLQLYSASVEVPAPGVPTVAFCYPGAGGVVACPCNNPPGGANRSCNNSENTGGASMVSTGSALLANDSLVFVTSGQRSHNIALLLQGTTPVPAGGTFGSGIRCFTGGSKILFRKKAVAGSITVPGAGDPSIHSMSATLLDLIAPGTHRYYCVYYRDGVLLGGCPANQGFNTTNSIDVLWL